MNTSIETSMSTIISNHLNGMPMNLVDHRSSLIKPIDELCWRNRPSLGVDDLKLFEDSDLLISSLTNNSDFIHITCDCGTSSILPQQRSHFQLSNFYRHRKKDKCSMIQSKLESRSHDARTQIVITAKENPLSQQLSTYRSEKTISPFNTDSSIEPKKK